MNAGRIHAIALALRDDLAATDSPALVAQLVQSLRQQVQDPAQPDHQVQVSSFREQLGERLASAPSNGFSAAWRLTLEELGVADLFGENLRERIEEIFLRNEITPSAAADDLSAIAERLQSLSTGLDQLITGLEFFGIGAEELAPGEFEVGFLIPRAAVANELEKLGKEFVELDDVLGPFLELGTGTRPDLEGRTISSSAFQVYLAAASGLALVMSKVIESLLTSYEKILNIRETHKRLKDDHVPDEAIEGILAHANERMEIDIAALTEELIAEFGQRRAADGRVNELRVDIKRSLRKVAKRIDEGYSIEVRSYPPPESIDLPEGAMSEAEEARRVIEERQPRMRAMNLTGTPILELPEGDENDDEGGDPTKANPA